MSPGLYGWKPPTSAVTDYMRERDLRDALARDAQRRSEQFQESRDWLAGYLSQKRRSSFDWSPKIITKQRIEETINAEEAEAAFQRTSQEAAQECVHEGMGDAAGEESVGHQGAGNIQQDAGGRAGRDERGDELAGAPSYAEPPF